MDHRPAGHHNIMEGPHDMTPTAVPMTSSPNPAVNAPPSFIHHLQRAAAENNNVAVVHASNMNHIGGALPGSNSRSMAISTGFLPTIPKLNIPTSSSQAVLRAEESHGHNGLTSISGGDQIGHSGTGGSNGMSAGHPGAPPSPTPPPHVDDVKVPASLDLKKALQNPVKYKECLKNHAANIGGHATDGCGEFMPSGEEGTLEALKCAACNCHRNFHRREVEGEVPYIAANCECRYGTIRERKRMMETLFPSPLPLPPAPGLHALPGRGGPAPSQMIMAFNPQLDSDDNYDGGFVSPQSPLKKRFRTKFTAEQKEQMNAFAEKLGWRIQKHDEAVVEQFCAEVGVKRHVLKVWMHNNKHALGKKLLLSAHHESNMAPQDTDEDLGQIRS